MQSELNVRARSGLTFQASHVWAKSLGNIGGDAPSTFNPEIIPALRWPTGSISPLTAAIWRTHDETGFCSLPFMICRSARTANFSHT